MCFVSCKYLIILNLFDVGKQQPHQQYFNQYGAKPKTQYIQYFSSQSANRNLSPKHSLRYPMFNAVPTKENKQSLCQYHIRQKELSRIEQNVSEDL